MPADDEEEEELNSRRARGSDGTGPVRCSGAFFGRDSSHCGFVGAPWQIWRTPNGEVGRMAVRKIAHPSVDDREAMGFGARERAPLPSHTKWSPATDRPDPVALLGERDKTREPDLVPGRHGRMMVSPFTFYRGAAKIMAADLAATRMAGVEAQLCG